MNWSSLLSGVIGALLGGILAIVASLMSARQQRSLTLATLAEERRQTQRPWHSALRSTRAIRFDHAIYGIRKSINTGPHE
jgi:hypothetical protein